MNKKETVGIDISKSTFDAYLYVNRKHKEFSDNPKGFTALVNWLEACSKSKINEIGICFEHTGLYSLPLATFFYKIKIIYSMLPGMEIKKY